MTQPSNRRIIFAGRLDWPDRAARENALFIGEEEKYIKYIEIHWGRERGGGQKKGSGEMIFILLGDPVFVFYVALLMTQLQ